MKVTLREVLFSIGIVLVLLAIAIVIQLNVIDNTKQSAVVYQKALQIENNYELFNHAINTNAGNAFITADVKTEISVSHKNIKGNYLIIKEYREKYTRHTRTVTTTDSKGKTSTRTETYWTWDSYSNNKIQAENVFINNYKVSTELLGNLPYKRFQISNETLTDNHDYKIERTGGNYIYERNFFGSDYRYYYEVVDTEYSGVAFVTFDNGTINGYKSKTINVHKDTTIAKLKKGLENSGLIWKTILLWFVFLLITGGSLLGFYYFENRWLNKE